MPNALKARLEAGGGGSAEGTARVVLAANSTVIQHRNRTPSKPRGNSTGTECSDPPDSVASELGHSTLMAELRLLYRCDRPEHAVHLAVGAGCAVERIGIGVLAAAQSQSPEPIDDQRLTVCVPDSAAEISGGGVIGVDRSVAEIADEDIATELTKGE